ncbi:MAG: tRNA 2-selenouridine(34) synthase MnmH [Bacteroidetes bacterium]|nr:MAG: tRNA 2-selenouridine(34) synthase MnmH [Bacteroidota bacterium]
MDIKKLISFSNLPLIDVRSESEFAQGHIPGAINKPLLNDDERKQVGICFKSKGREEAIQLGYSLVGHKFKDKLRDVSETVDGNKVNIYCWRGGLRSKIFSEILEEGSFEVSRLKHGYKSYRKWALHQFNIQPPLIILGGATGTGKTELLHTLKKKGEQVIDLEDLANHKGSAYGGIKMKTQPTNEQFENELALKLNYLTNDKPIWIENESRLIGKIKIPDQLYEYMRTAKVIDVELPLQLRVKRIAKEYAALPKAELIKATSKLEKRLGNRNMNLAIEHLNNDEHDNWIEIMLVYYDKMYAYGMSLRKKEDIYKIEFLEDDATTNAEIILKYYYEHIDRNTRTTANTI